MLPHWFWHIKKCLWGTAVLLMLSIQNPIPSLFQSHVSLCWASMILSHSIWLDKGVVDVLLGAQQKKLGGLSERPLTQGGVSLQQAEFPREIGNSENVAPLHHLGISGAVQYSMMLWKKNLPGILPKTASIKVTEMVKLFAQNSFSLGQYSL